MEKTLDQRLRDDGYRVIATLHRMELFQRVADEIPGIERMDFYIIPVHMALGEEPLGPAYDGLHRIYVREK